MVFSRWRKGDILCIDNFSTSHGRQPTYDKGRKVIVAWSHPHNKTTLVIPEPTVSVDNSAWQSITDKTLPDLLAASPGPSLESTLTNMEAKELKESFFNHRFKEQMAIEFSK
jgi:hypothetical protein